MGYPVIYREIRAEVRRAKKLHPSWPVDIVHQVAKISEEAGEAVQAANNNLEYGASKSFIRADVIQCAATCIRYLEKNKKERV